MKGREGGREGGGEEGKEKRKERQERKKQAASHIIIIFKEHRKLVTKEYSKETLNLKRILLFNVKSPATHAPLTSGHWEHKIIPALLAKSTHRTSRNGLKSKGVERKGHCHIRELKLHHRETAPRQIQLAC